jgi:hypothetical protein
VSACNPGGLKDVISKEKHRKANDRMKPYGPDSAFNTPSDKKIRAR